MPGTTRSVQPSDSSPDAAVLPRLAEVIHLVTGLDVAEVRPERTFVDDLRIDSLSMVEILEGAAGRFGVPVEDEAAKQLVRVGDLVDYLQWQLTRLTR